MVDAFVSTAELLRRAMDSRLGEVHTAMPGKITKYYTSEQTADVQPCLKDGDETLPEIPRIRVGWPRGGDGYLVFPLSAGDYGLLIFCEADLSAWERAGETIAPGDASRHGINGAVFYPGIYPSGYAIAAPSGATVLAGSDVRLGDATADQSVMRFETFIKRFMAWELAVSTAAGAPSFIATTPSPVVSPEYLALGLASEKVKVD